MSTINAANLELKLAQKINNTTAPLELLALGTALRQLQNGAVFVVQQFSQLPSASANLGQLYFVIDDGIVYVSTPDLVGTALWKLLATDSISQVFTWGQGTSGQLGNGVFTTRSSPGSTCGGGSTWCQIDTSSNRTAALKTDSTAWAWGAGGVGDGTNVARCTPVSLAGDNSNWCQISVGTTAFAAIKLDGSAWTWGVNTCGQLGDGTTDPRCSPVQVVHASGNCCWCQISAGWCHIAAVKKDGTAWTWGAGNEGRLGHNSTASRCQPGDVAGVNENWCQISAGSANTAAIKINGEAYSWGDSRFGQLGNGGTTGDTCVPGLVNGGSNWIQISVGTQHMAALQLGGCAWTWGQGSSGQLGNNTVTACNVPVQPSGTNALWSQISANGLNTAAVKTDGTAWTWGRGAEGQIGDGTLTPRSSPVLVSGTITPWCQISAGYHTAAIASKTL
jgi:alpha-tubulin suppressor-like RCC1 family protein